jgi:hypothetical protein
MFRRDYVKNGEQKLGTQQNPENSSKILFSEEVLRLANNSSFLPADHTDDSGNVILAVAGVRL